MHPFASTISVTTLRAHLPCFEAPYRALLEDYGEDLTTQVVFQELADLVASALLEGTTSEERLEAAFSAIEQVARLERIEAVEAVGLCFLASLPEEALGLADAYLGPKTASLLEELLAGTLQLEELEG